MSAKPQSLGRVQDVYPAEGFAERVRLAGIEVDVLNLHHGRSRPEIQNLGFIIHLAGLRILHVGDTEASTRDLDQYPVLKDAVDVALLPGWFLTERRWIEAVTDLLRPRLIVAMHVAEENAPPGYFGSAGSRQHRLQVIRDNFPDAIILESGESFQVKP